MTPMVIIEVEGGIAHVVYKDRGCIVFVLDRDNVEAGDTLEDATLELTEDATFDYTGGLWLKRTGE